MMGPLSSKVKKFGLQGSRGPPSLPLGALKAGIKIVQIDLNLFSETNKGEKFFRGTQQTEEHDTSSVNSRVVGLGWFVVFIKVCTNHLSLPVGSYMALAIYGVLLPEFSC